ncbi:hypothetical protein CZ771_12260 [Actinomycetales bacterium JB111]|nr:hypothetical protein CZ771_12260 [Actinomycetales bacterium JB111]
MPFLGWRPDVPGRCKTGSVPGGGLRSWCMSRPEGGRRRLTGEGPRRSDEMERRDRPRPLR